jgi:mannose-6-phosphate isomerase-like protein (cupin superfamily)
VPARGCTGTPTRRCSWSNPGEASFQLGHDTMVVRAGQIVVGPANVPHGFTNTGTGPLRLTAIHGAAAFDTEWVSEPDPVWASKPER